MTTLALSIRKTERTSVIPDQIKINHHHSWLHVVAIAVEHRLTVSPLVPTSLAFRDHWSKRFNMSILHQLPREQTYPPWELSRFLPAPDNWKQVLKLPPNTKKLCITSFLKEVVRKGTVVCENSIDDDIIPVTAKYRVKLISVGLVDKLKTRITLRGDLIWENILTSNTWCPIAGLRALKIFLAFAAEYKQRINQLDYVDAFLQAGMIERRFTMFPSCWKELLKDYPDLHQWLGVPLRLKSHCTEIASPISHGTRRNRSVYRVQQSGSCAYQAKDLHTSRGRMFSSLF
jgi:hypothetical protein